MGSGRVAALPLIPTTVIGSYPQPSWLVDHDMLVEKGVPRTRAADVWRIPPPDLDEALDAATLLAIHDQARAGIDIVHSLASTAPLRGGIPRVTTIHDLLYRKVPESHFGVRGLGMRVLVPAAARRSTRVIVDAESTRDDLE